MENTTGVSFASYPTEKVRDPISILSFSALMQFQMALISSSFICVKSFVGCMPETYITCSAVTSQTPSIYLVRKALTVSKPLFFEVSLPSECAALMAARLRLEENSSILHSKGSSLSKASGLIY